MVTLANKYNLIIKNYFSSNFKSFCLTESRTHGPFFYTELKDEAIKVIIQGDIGAFEILIFIEDEKFNLWQYDKSVMEKTTSNSENIVYQLKILQELIKSLSV